MSFSMESVSTNQSPRHFNNNNNIEISIPPNGRNFRGKTYFNVTNSIIEGLHVAI